MNRSTRKRHRAAGMRKDDPDIRIARRGAAEYRPGDGPRRIRSPFNGAVADAGNQIAAAVGGDRVSVNHGLAPVEFLIYGSERRISQPFIPIAGKQADAVGFQRVQPVLDLVQGAVVIGHGHVDKHAEPSGVVGREPGGVIVAQTGHAAPVCLVAERHAGRGYRNEGSRDAGAIHILDGFGRAPGRQCRPTQFLSYQLCDVCRRSEMAVDVDPVRGVGRYCMPGRQSARSQRGKTSQKKPPRRANRGFHVGLQTSSTIHPTGELKINYST